MYDSKVYAERELQYQETLIRLYVWELKKLPTGRLSVHWVHGKPYYYALRGGKRLYLGGDSHPAVRKMQKRYYLEHALADLRRNRAVLQKMIASYRSVSPDQILKQLPKAYQMLETVTLPTLDGTDLSGWGSEPYVKSQKYPESLQHRTLKGEFVRSKSEALIANLLFLKGIAYRYEEVIKIGEVTLAPDFRIAVPGAQQIKILEHFGKIGDPDYLEDAMWKIRYYLEHGYVPGDTVLFTFEDVDGNINTQQIDAMIEQFCH